MNQRERERVLQAAKTIEQVAEGLKSNNPGIAWGDPANGIGGFRMMRRDELNALTTADALREVASALRVIAESA